jgi:hypothetical protein
MFGRSAATDSAATNPATSRTQIKLIASDMDFMGNSSRN